MTYRFLGGYAELLAPTPENARPNDVDSFGYAKRGTLKLDRYGQKVELQEEEALMHIREGVDLLPDEDFWDLGNTEAELVAFPNSHRQQIAPPEFHEKRIAGLKQVAQLREQLKIAG